MKPGIKNKSGFSLIELMMVLAIIGIMAVVAVPSFRNLMQRMRLNAAGREITMDLLLARARAINTGQPQTITFNVSAGSWTTTGTSVEKFLIRGYYGIAFQYSDADPIKFKDKNGNDVDTVTFKPDGSLDNNLSSYTSNPGSGEIYLLDTKNGVEKRTIQVNQYTGLARLRSGWISP